VKAQASLIWPNRAAELHPEATVDTLVPSIINPRDPELVMGRIMSQSSQIYVGKMVAKHERM